MTPPPPPPPESSVHDVGVEGESIPPPTNSDDEAGHLSNDTPEADSAHVEDNDSPDANHVINYEANAHPPSSCFSTIPTLLRSALHNPDQLTAMISNYSTSYNAVNVGIVLPVLKYSLTLSTNSDAEDAGSPAASFVTGFNSDTTTMLSTASVVLMSLQRMSTRLSNSLLQILQLFPINATTHTAFQSTRHLKESKQDEEQDSIVASSLLAGMIVGQLIGGFLGDVLGRRNAMLMVMMLQIGGSLGSALLIHETSNYEGFSALEQLALWRFLLGIGAGGVYPLAAVMSAENKEDDGGEDEHTPEHEKERSKHRLGYTATSDNEDDQYLNYANEVEDNSTIQSFQRIALTFSTQGLGFITVPLLAYPMLEWRWDVDLIWRLLLGVGAIPGFIVLYLRMFWRRNHHKSKEISREGSNEGENNPLSSDVDESTINADQSMTKQHQRNQGGSLELAPSKADIDGSGTVEEDNSPFQSAVSNLFIDMLDSDASVHHAVDHQMSLVDHSHIENGNSNDDNRNDEADEPTTQLQHSPGLWASIKNEPNLRGKFVGTAGTWFLFDVLFYGNTLFEPLVLEAAFGSHESNDDDGYGLLQTAVRDSLVISLLSLPGYFVSVLLIGRRISVCRSLRSSYPTRCSTLTCFSCTQTPAFVQMQGFILMFALYLILGLFWGQLSNNQWLLLILYGGTFFFANYGPNTTTFLLPSVTYSEKCRSTLNGLSAACGKLGALCGASVFAPAADEWGESLVMVCCGIVALIAFGLTKLCLGGRREDHCVEI